MKCKNADCGNLAKYGLTNKSKPAYCFKHKPTDYVKSLYYCNYCDNIANYGVEMGECQFCYQHQNSKIHVNLWLSRKRKSQALDCLPNNLDLPVTIGP